MSPALSTPNDLDPPEDPRLDCPVSITVPEGFAGSVMGQISAHRGVIKQINVMAETILIQALISERQFTELARQIKEWTRDRGKVDRDRNLDE